MPLTLAKLVNILEGHTAGSPWPYIFAYAGFRFLQGSGGLSAIRDVCFLLFVSERSDIRFLSVSGPQSCNTRTGVRIESLLFFFLD